VEADGEKRRSRYYVSLLPFANMQEARLLASKKVAADPAHPCAPLVPRFLVDEGSIIAERSPIYSDVGFDNAARKRMLSYLLTGKDDSGILSRSDKEIVQRRHERRSR